MFSTADWDFSNANWTLSTTYKVSSPTSLHDTASPAPRVLVKTTVVPIANVKQGQIITWGLAIAWAALNLIFRYQDVNNFYYVQIIISSLSDYARVYRVKAGVSTLLKEVSIGALGYGVWRKFKISWWSEYIGLCIRVEYWTGTEWTTWMEAYDEDNWKDVGGRVGFDLYEARLYVDDTEIWGVPP